MKLWLLRPIDKWEHPYDRSHGYVIASENESRARQIAKEDDGDEWTNQSLTFCVEIGLATPGFPEGVVISDVLES